MNAPSPRCPQCHEGDPVSGPINDVIWHECQHCDYAWRDESPTNPPGTSPIYAVAGDMLAAVAPGDSPSMGRAGGYVGTCHADLTRYGNEWALALDDVHRIERDTLVTWAAAVGQDAGGWLIDQSVGGRVARLEWTTNDKPMPDGGGVMWIGQ